MRKVLIFSLLTVTIIVMTTFTAVDAVEKNREQQEKDIELSSSKNITFDFSNADLKVFAGFVAKLCRKSLIGEDDLLKQKISIESQKKMNLHQVKKVFRSVLNSKGLDYRETDVYMEIFSVADSIMKVYRIKYLKSADIAKSLSSMFRMSFKVGNKSENIQITSIDSANSVMVLASNSQQLEIEKAIKKLDSRTSQVLLDIMVVEVTKTSEFGFGINYRYDGGSAAGTAQINPIGPYDHTGKTAPPTFTTSAVSSVAGFGVLEGRFSLNMQAVDQKTKIKILSQPRILAKENEKASIKIGEKQNYIKGSSSLGSESDSSGTTQTTGVNDLGLDIEITPRINKRENVIIELKLKITNVLGNYSFSNSTATDTQSGGDDSTTTNIPIVGERIINNTSSMMSGETLVIGGLLKNNKTVIRDIPPILGDIPLIGWLLSKESEATEQVELMVFITPTVIKDTEDGRVVTKMEANKLRNYDPAEKATIDQMLTGRKARSYDLFNLFDYFKDGKYRKEQDFVPEPENL